MASPMPRSPRRVAASSRRSRRRARQARTNSLASATRRLEDLLAEGVTTVEIKSGYGLDVETELKMLKVARELGKRRSGRCQYDLSRRPCLSAGIPREPRRLCEACLRSRLCRPSRLRVLPMRSTASARGSPFRSRRRSRSSRAAKALGPAGQAPCRAIVQSRRCQAWRRAMARCRSITSNISTRQASMAIAKSGTVAVLLPGAFYYLREKQVPPVAHLRAHGVPIAIATDLNPGSSPVHSLLTTMNMACVLFGLTPEEALLGVTANAARALGLKDRGTHRTGPEGRSRVVGCRAAGRSCLSAWRQSLRRRDPRWRSWCGAASHERAAAALRQGQGSHPRPYPLRRLGAGRARAFRKRTGRELRHQPDDRQSRLARIDRRWLPRARSGRRHLRARSGTGTLQPHGIAQHRRGDRRARPSP